MFIGDCASLSFLLPSLVEILELMSFFWKGSFVGPGVSDAMDVEIAIVGYWSLFTFVNGTGRVVFLLNASFCESKSLVALDAMVTNLSTAEVL